MCSTSSLSAAKRAPAQDLSAIEDGDPDTCRYSGELGERWGCADDQRDERSGLGSRQQRTVVDKLYKLRRFCHRRHGAESPSRSAPLPTQPLDTGAVLSTCCAFRYGSLGAWRGPGS